MMNAEPEPIVTLRKAGAADLVAALRLNEASVPAVNSVDLETMRWFATNAAYFKVAMRGEKLAGFLIGMRPGTTYASPNYRWFCNKYDDFGYVDRVAIAHDARRLGLATRLYRDFEASLPASAKVLTCEVNIVPPNESSMLFHEAYGFETVGSQTLDDGCKEVALLAMSRKS
ncbi:MAG TPA: GNAT family N-acetyltransferase [Woeseiaceae bacterium]|nr:GNAT family N-acetyltransferase [Woeseiaceae bacterium]